MRNGWQNLDQCNSVEIKTSGHIENLWLRSNEPLCYLSNSELKMWCIVYMYQIVKCLFTRIQVLKLSKICVKL